MQDNGQNAVFLSGPMDQFCLIKGYGTCVWGGGATRDGQAEYCSRYITLGSQDLSRVQVVCD